jgi:hypothetical protein
MKINCLRKEKEKIIFEDVDNPLTTAFDSDFFTPLVRTPERFLFAGISAILICHASAGLRVFRQFSPLI